MEEHKTGNDFLEIARVAIKDMQLAIYIFEKSSLYMETEASSKVSAGNISGALDAVKGAECLSRSALKRIREFRKDLEEALDGAKEPEIISREEVES